MDMRDVGKLKEQFDGIFAQASLLHIPKAEVKDAMKKLLEKLKVGGYFYIAVKEKGGEKWEEVKVEKDYGYKYERFFSYYTMDEILKYLENLNMKIVYQTITKPGDTNWIQVVAKK